MTDGRGYCHQSHIRRTEIYLERICPDDKVITRFTIFALIYDCVFFLENIYAYRHEKTNLLLSNDVNARELRETCIWCDKKIQKIDNNDFSNRSLKIFDFHRKSRYQQNKNIARSVDDSGIALCSFFVDILIFYANLKFSVGHGTLTKQVSQCILHVFFSCKIKGLRLKQAYASLFMQNMYVERLIENIRAKIFIKPHFVKFMIHLAWVVNLMVISSALYGLVFFFF